MEEDFIRIKNKMIGKKDDVLCIRKK